MNNFAVIKDETIINVIVADNAETALKYGGGTEVLETTGQPWIGWTLVDGEWIDPTVTEGTND
jgi:hypothetical protein